MKLGLVGAGFMGGVHLNAYAGIPGVEVVGVADARPDNAAAAAALVGARPYASYEELVAAEEVEVVDVCLPTSFHKRSEEHTSELQSRQYLVCRLLLEKKK